MISSIRAIFAMLALCFTLAGATAANAQYWQCAPFARQFSGLDLYGAAAGWWMQAEGRYARGPAPAKGAVLVFKAAGSMRHGHVATVSDIVDPRTIRVTHANWSIINGARGQIERDVAVIDVSANNDWSRVRVWYAPLNGLGTSSHPVHGFIYAPAAPEQAPVPRLEFAALDIAG